jgi:hypothetical protein
LRVGGGGEWLVGVRRCGTFGASASMWIRWCTSSCAHWHTRARMRRRSSASRVGVIFPRHARPCATLSMPYIPNNCLLFLLSCWPRGVKSPGRSGEEKLWSESERSLSCENAGVTSVAPHLRFNTQHLHGIAVLGCKMMPRIRKLQNFFCATGDWCARHEINGSVTGHDS